MSDDRIDAVGGGEAITREGVATKFQNLRGVNGKVLGEDVCNVLLVEARVNPIYLK